MANLKNEKKFQDIVYLKMLKNNQTEKTILSNLNELKEGENFNKFVVLKVLRVIHNNDKTP